MGHWEHYRGMVRLGNEDAASWSGSTDALGRGATGIQVAVASPTLKRQAVAHRLAKGERRAGGTTVPGPRIQDRARLGR